MNMKRLVIIISCVMLFGANAFASNYLIASNDKDLKANQLAPAPSIQRVESDQEETDFITEKEALVLLEQELSDTDLEQGW